ncbi:hypothetical protein EV06_2026 [Prochlorococcus sp. MIT 0602]|nr:hypothetical protein EV06_2026 [Prochlorococcus sp. MIT 0602]KGG15607.1 hypothetical protein EV07_1572 [Prochlorococcus sp. MIT 0603]
MKLISNRLFRPLEQSMLSIPFQDDLFGISSASLPIKELLDELLGK